MLVDLSRNDLQRVCDAGSVEVVDIMSVHRYSHIMHLESTVVGALRADRSAYDVLAATFPAGTLSGAPKPVSYTHLDVYKRQQVGAHIRFPAMGGLCFERSTRQRCTTKANDLSGKNGQLHLSLIHI